MEHMHLSKNNVHAASAARQIRQSLGLDDGRYPVGIILGTGWGDALKIEDAKEMDFKDIPGFADLRALEGHDRKLVVGRIGGTDVVALRGRIHLYESADPSIYSMVRLQTEMLIHLGAKRLILTNSAGGLRLPSGRIQANVGDVMLIDGFCTLFAGPMPVFGEHPSPDDAIDRALLERVRRRFPAEDPMAKPPQELRLKYGGYAMVRGPYFEGRRYDKPALAATGCSVVGMSTLPETVVAALYRQDGVRVAPISFVSNDEKEEHSHHLVISRTRDKAAMLASFLTVAIEEAAKAASAPNDR
jgi:purine-nucleoside phosphorylase